MKNVGSLLKGVDDKCPHCRWRVSTAYVVASSEDEAKNLVVNGIWLCGNCMADMLVDRGYTLKRVLFR